MTEYTNYKVVYLDKEVGRFLIVQARSAREAKQIATSIIPVGKPCFVSHSWR